jgi:hypothetical protein
MEGLIVLFPDITWGSPLLPKPSSTTCPPVTLVKVPLIKLLDTNCEVFEKERLGKTP